MRAPFPPLQFPRPLFRPRTLLTLPLVMACMLPENARADNWPAWRGPGGQGISLEKNLPVEWSTTKNVKWKLPLPDTGNSTPIIWGRKLFLTQAIHDGKERMLFCIDKEEGKILWKRGVEYDDREPTHRDNPFCAASPVTDGERVIVSHGSAGVVCYDLDGEEIWRRDLGKFRHIWGNASSPVIHGDLCYLNCGPGKRTFLVALKKHDGKTVWQNDIPGGYEALDTGGKKGSWTGSWSTPVLHRTEKRESLLVSFPHRLHAYDPKSGKELWSCGGLGPLAYASPLISEGIVVSLSGFRGPPMAVRVGGDGDVTETHQVWREDRGQQRIGSGVIRDGHIYIGDDTGAAACLELKTGKEIWRNRLGRSTWSSMVLADGKLYIPDQEGTCYVLEASTEFKIHARIPLGERTRASFAISDGALFLRTYENLWCIAKN